ncbi:MAG TPA: hypothetical protein VMU47_04110 [Caldimonas sp.]|nr:hypothetical protein [Caldimonas sp.]
MAHRNPAILAAALACALAVPGARAQDGGPTFEHSADCVAALEVEAIEMADQLRAGKTEIEPELVRRVQEGFAFIGVAYKQGLRKEEADKLLKQAEANTQTLPHDELVARQAACRSEGARLLANANLFERAFVAHAAQRRVDRLKQPKS